MSFVLMVFLVLLNGYTHNEAASFSTLAECEDAMKALPAKMVDYNVGGNPNKIAEYAAVCVRTVAAPQGKEV